MLHNSMCTQKMHIYHLPL